MVPVLIQSFIYPNNRCQKFFRNFFSIIIRLLLRLPGMPGSATVDEVLSLWKEGKSVEEIMSTLERSRASVNSYLPYTKIIYKMKESSVGADREKLYRERKKAVAEMACLLYTSPSPRD